MVQPNQQDPEFPPVERKYSRRMHGMSLRARNFGEKIKATLARSRAPHRDQNFNLLPGAREPLAS